MTEKWMDVNIKQETLDRSCNDLQDTALCHAHPACECCLFFSVENFKEYIEQAQKKERQWK